MASWNEVTPDPDVKELSKHASEAKDVEADDDKPGDLLHAPASAEDFNHERLDVGDLADDLTGNFDD